MHEERFHGYVLILVNYAWLNLVHVHLVTGAVTMLEAVGSNGYVFAVSGEQMIGHRFETVRAVTLERIFSTEHPWTEDEIGITEGVIGMQMSDKNGFQFLNGETGHSLAKRGARAANHPRTAIHKIRRVVNRNRHRRSGPFRVGARISSAEHDDLCAR